MIVCLIAPVYRSIEDHDAEVLGRAYRNTRSWGGKGALRRPTGSVDGEDEETSSEEGVKVQGKRKRLFATRRRTLPTSKGKQRRQEGQGQGQGEESKIG